MRITLKSLKRSYGKLRAVNDVSLTIPSNTIFGIIGKSGAGKSTLVRLVSLLEKPDEGEVYYDEKRVDNLPKEDLMMRRRHIGMIFQNFNLFSSRNCAQNIAYPMEINGYKQEEIKSRVHELLKLVDLEGREEAHISTLSGGQKQRVAIARALSCRPDILFCDEATSALDPQTTSAILDLIKDIQKRMSLTVVMITHQMEVVRDTCKEVAVLNDGEVVEQGKVSDIFSHPQNQVTKDFLSRLVGHDERKTRLYQWSHKEGSYLLRFPGNVTDRPVISQISRKYGVDFNLRAGGVQVVDGEEIGTMIVDILSPDVTALPLVLDELRNQGVIVEEAEHHGN
jgi:D-methionine transport system ATP-binding protein